MQERLAELDHQLTLGGILGGMRYLNSRVAHRFTAVYRLDGEMLRGVDLVDKLNPKVVIDRKAVPLNSTFCQFAVTTQGFSTENTLKDARLEGHWLKDTWGSYTGIPLLSNAGRLFGTFCHFDNEPQVLSNVEFDFLHAAVRLFPPYLESRTRESGLDAPLVA
jgi:GAF domain-containing protein